ncbi:hypothetical protein Tco_0010376 [Tanacetum coccineum]
MKVFPLSLADDVRQWWINEGEGKITTWEELVEKLFCKFYPESHDGEDEMLDEGDNWGIDPLEFISRVNSSFKNHMKVDGRTKEYSFHSWMTGIIIEYLVKISEKAPILELKQRNMKITVLTPNTLYPSRKTRRSGYQQKDRKPSQNDKTEHGMEKTVQNQGQSPKMPKSESKQKNQQSNRSRN